MPSLTPLRFAPFAAMLGALVLAGCASAFQGPGRPLGPLTPYRMDIVQGNVVTKELLATVETGMTRRQVADRLGTPMIMDAFHASRWDYPFSIRRQGAQPQDRVVVMHFDGDKLVRIEAPELPSEQEFVALISRGHKDFQPRKLELTEAEIAALPVPPPRAASAPEPTSPVRAYPPLEPAGSGG